MICWRSALRAPSLFSRPMYAVADRLHVADGLVRGALHVDLPAAGEQALDDDHAEAAPLVDHDDVADDQLPSWASV